jgi:hypothetical protein
MSIVLLNFFLKFAIKKERELPLSISMFYKYL